MKKTAITHAVAFGLTMLVAGPVNAEEFRRWSLKDAIETALVHNHQVKAASHSAEATTHGTTIARARYFPGIYFEESFSISNAPTQTFMMKLDQGRFSQSDFQISTLNHPASHQDFKTSLTVQQPLFDPTAGPLGTVAHVEADRGRTLLTATRQDAAFQVFRLFLDVQRTTARLSAAEQALNQARESLRLAKVRHETGTGLKSDELRARTHLSGVEQQHISARHGLIMAQLRLANQLGQPEGSRADVDENTAPLTVSISKGELARLTQVERSDLKLAFNDVERAEASARLARAAYMPSLSAFASYQMDARHTPFGNDNDSWLAGVNLKWLLFDGFRRSGERSRAAASLSAAREEQIARSRHASLQITESLLRYEEAGKRLEVARHAREDAEETVRLLNRRFENSLATMSELLDAQTALFQVKANLAESETDHILASGSIYYAAGTFLKEITK